MATAKKGKTVSAQDTQAKLRARPHFIVIFPNVDARSSPYASQDVFISTNGFVQSCRRGHKVALSDVVINRLQNTTRIDYVMRKGEDGKTRSTPVEVQDYPFQVLGPCTADGKPLPGAVDSMIPRGTKKGPRASKALEDKVEPLDLPPLASP